MEQLSCQLSGDLLEKDGWRVKLKAPLSVVHGSHTFPECLGFGVKGCVSFHAICWP